MAERRRSLAIRLLQWALAHPVASFGLIVAALTLPSLWAKDLWFPDETRHGAVLVQMVEQGHWLALHLGDTFYADKPPLYFWLVAGLALLTGSTQPPVFMAATAVSGWAFLAALVVLGRQARLSRKAVLLAGLMLLSSWFFIERLHHPRMDLLFAAFILLAQAGMLSALNGGRGAVPGFAAAALAVLTKGPAGVVLPLASLAVGLAIFRSWPRRLWRSVSAGALVFAAILALYLAGVAAAEGPAAVRALIFDQSLGRAVAAESLSQPVHWYLLPLAAAMLPWTLALSALRLVQFRARRVAWLWAGFAASLAVLSLADYKATHFLVPLLGPMALGLAQAICQVPHPFRRRLFLAIGAALALAAALLPLAPGWTLWPDHVRGTALVASGAALTALLALLAHRRSPVVFAAAICLGMVLTAVPYYLITIRGLNVVMAPTTAAAILAEQSSLGHAAVEFHPRYRGIFDYHADLVVTQAADHATLDRIVAAHPCGVVAIRPEDLAQWDGAPDGLSQLGLQRLDYTQYALMQWGGASCR